MRFVSLMVLAAALIGALPLASGGDRSVIIFAADPTDARVAATRQAVQFWNQTFSDLNLRPRLHEPRVVVASPIGRVLENYARFISQRGGRLARAGVEAKPPPELDEFQDDIVVFLSKQSINSFSWPLGKTSRFFLGIRSGEFPPLVDPNGARNVIAHELGHALGLSHNRNPTTLMCGPCRPVSSAWENGVFLPLTAQDRVRLIELYPSMN